MFVPWSCYFERLVHPVDEILITQSCISCWHRKGIYWRWFARKDRDVTRFLWLKDITKPDKTENIAALRFTRIPLDVISSQFIFAVTIVHDLMEKGTAVLKKIRKDIYGDNLITGTNTERSALQIYLKGKEVFEEMSMNLTEWASDSIILQRYVQ